MFTILKFLSAHFQEQKTKLNIIGFWLILVRC